MDNKKFYIVPSTKTYYEEVAADSAEEAIVDFATSMDMDMSAYFKAVEEEPKLIHGYKYPEGSYEVAMKILAENGTDIDMSNIDGISSLQKCYDALPNSKRANDELISNFLHILEELTGGKPFFDDNEEDEGESEDCGLSLRLAVDGLDDEERAGEIEAILDKMLVDYDYDDGGRLMVSPSEVKQIIDELEKEGFDCDLL